MDGNKRAIAGLVARLWGICYGTHLAIASNIPSSVDNLWISVNSTKQDSYHGKGAGISNPYGCIA